MTAASGPTDPSVRSKAPGRGGPPPGPRAGGPRANPRGRGAGVLKVPLVLNKTKSTPIPVAAAPVQMGGLSLAEQL